MDAREVTFRAFFVELWKRPPFGWQERLADEVATRGWPRSMDLPTGTGKTAAIDVAVWHLATSTRGTAPRRIFFVVDRRIVVDSAYQRAKHICDELQRALVRDDSPPALRATATALHTLGGLVNVPPLAVTRLRGGVPRDPDWALTPAQPLVAISTVDQVGSRLLFRGYGVSDAMLPVEAALIGADALILLDEAHLSEPFRQTLHGLEGLRAMRSEQNASLPGLRYAEMSATRRDGAQSSTFTLSDEEWQEGPLAQRLGASKRARLIEVKGDRPDLVSVIVDATMKHTSAGDGQAHATLVVVNRVATARAVFDALHGKLELPVSIELAIGPSRPLDRDKKTEGWLPLIRAGRDDDGAPRNVGDCPFILVATQCVEAGADIDADALVTESASLDALRQRFGRLDRLGRLPATQGNRATLIHLRRKGDDEVYGGSLAATWECITDEVSKSGDMVDFSSLAMRAALSRLGTRASLCVSPHPDAPVLLPSHLDAWAQTSPPAIAPTPALFLHGPLSVPDVTIVWRGDVSQQDLESTQVDRRILSLELLPPSALESVTISVWAVRRWMRGEPPTPSEDVADLEGVFSADEDRGVPISTRVDSIRALRREGDHEWTVVGPGDVRPGDSLVVPADAGGCDEWGWNPDRSAARSVSDVAEAANERQRGRWIRRVVPALVASHGKGLTWGDVAITLTEHSEEPARLLPALAEKWDLGLLGELRRLDGSIEMRGFRTTWIDVSDPSKGVILSYVSAPTHIGGRTARLPSTANDDGSFSHTAVELEDHLGHVLEWTVFLTDRLGVTGEVRTALLEAARWHDLGKAHPAFQAMLRGQARLSRFDDRPLLAKSALPWHPSAARSAGLPPGWRHEVLSTVLADEVLRSASASVRDLGLWLISTHHGRGRPWFDETGEVPGRITSATIGGIVVTLAANVSASDIIAAHTERYSRLTKQYGVHALAWLEAILRLADHRASAYGRGPEQV